MTTTRDEPTGGYPASWEYTQRWLEEFQAGGPTVDDDPGPTVDDDPGAGVVDQGPAPQGSPAALEESDTEQDEPDPDHAAGAGDAEESGQPKPGPAGDGWLSRRAAADEAPEATGAPRTTLDDALIQEGVKLGGGGSSPRFNKKLALAFAGGVSAIALTLTLLLMSVRSGPAVAPTPAEALTAVSIAAAAPQTTAPAVADDAPIPFTAQAQCPIGSTTAQAVANDDPTQAWVCVRDGVDGQVIEIQLGRPMLITAVSQTPWIGTDSSGAEQWLQHRVVTRGQWTFNTVPPTTVTQNTGTVHGEAVQAMPERGVLASAVTLLIQETSRPTADTPPESTEAPNPFGAILPPSAGDSPMTNLLGPAETAGADPSDTTVAISNIKIIGHPPL